MLRVVARRRSGFSDLFNSRGKDTDAKKRPPLRPGKVSPKLPVPEHIPKPPYADSGRMPQFDQNFQMHGEEGIQRMREAGKLAAQVRDYAGTLVKPGVTTDEIDRAVHKMIIDAGAYPSPLNYGGFPKSVCTSVNECICHGIPDSRALREGDIINIDVTVFLNGYHGDTSKTFLCGKVEKEAIKLVEVTRESLDRAIAVCRPGAEFREIGNAINDLADEHGYGVIRHFIGHGVGKVFHSAPNVLHYRNNDRTKMVVGQTFTIEPMLTASGLIDDRSWPDNWTYVTADGSLSAQFEHTLLITESGVDILTL